MQKKTSIALAIVVILVTITLVAYYAWDRETSEPGSEVNQTSLRLKWTFSAGFAGAIVADALDHFRDRGLEVDIEVGGPGLDPLQLVANGQNTFGITGADRLLQARAQGLPVVAIALENRQSFATFVSLADSGITRAEDFRGKRVGVFYDDTYTVLQALLGRLGMELDDVQEVPLSYDLSPLLEGVVDVYSAYRINQPPKLREMGVNFYEIDPRNYGVDFAGNVYFTSEEFLANERETVAAFVNGLREGWRVTFANPNRALDLVMEREPTLDRAGEAALLAALVEALQEQDHELLSITVDDLAGTHDEMLRQGLLREPVKLSEAIVDLK